MKRMICVLLAAVWLLGCAPAVGAAYVSGAEAIAALEALELVQGTGQGFEPERSATRGEALVMLLRLLGLEEQACSADLPCPFWDGGWAAAYIAFAREQGLAQGKGSTYFGTDEAVSARDYLTFVLRALGYSEAAGDFSWEESIAFSDAIGLTHGEYRAKDPFLREDLALVSYTALTLPVKGTETPLLLRLYRQGVVSAAAVKRTRLAGLLTADKPVYTGTQIHEMAASAVFFVECYVDAAHRDSEKPKATGSGFFVTADGLALLSAHELQGGDYARITTLDGRRYDVEQVLYYDAFRDAALIRVSRTDSEGRTVRFFPYLELGDSDALSSGDMVYTVSNPCGLRDSISDGLIANCSRVVDDPAYPCIQMTSPISQGSSGGVLLNRHGEAIGIIYAYLPKGESLYLAVPVNSLPQPGSLEGGRSMADIRAEEEAGVDAANISIEGGTELHLTVGEEVKLMVSHDAPRRMNLQYTIGDRSVVECAWGSFVTVYSVPITIRGTEAGETDLVIRFTPDSGNDTAELTVHVIVEDTAQSAE